MGYGVEAKNITRFLGLFCSFATLRLGILHGARDKKKSIPEKRGYELAKENEKQKKKTNPGGILFITGAESKTENAVQPCMGSCPPSSIQKRPPSVCVKEIQGSSLDDNPKLQLGTNFHCHLTLPSTPPPVSPTPADKKVSISLMPSVSSTSISSICCSWLRLPCRCCW